MSGCRNDKAMRHDVEVGLETSRVAGYRSGMSSTGMIGRRLARVYDVATDVPRDMGALLRTLEGKAGGAR